MIFTRRFLILLTAGFFFFLLSEVFPFFAQLGIFYVGALFVVAFFDWLSTPGLEVLQIIRIFDQSFEEQHANQIQLDITSNSEYTLSLLVKDDFPSCFIPDHDVVSCLISPFSQRKVMYQLTALRRGRYTFGRITVRLRSVLGLVMKQGCRTVKEDEIFVYPDISFARRYILFQRKQRSFAFGLRTLQMRGRGTDFESLREYVPDDDIRWINWKATANKYKPISKNFQVERSQDLYLFIDCSRLMAGKIQNKIRLDYAVRLAAALSYFALEIGDKIGIVIFSSEVRTFLVSQKARQHFGHIMEALYTAEPDLRAVNYSRAFSFFERKKKKRSLIVLFTEIEEGSARSLFYSYLTLLCRSHLVCTIMVRDPAIERLASQIPDNEKDLFKKAIANQLLMDRERNIRKLSSSGALTLDLPPSLISIATLNKYIEMKTRYSL